MRGLSLGERQAHGGVVEEDIAREVLTLLTRNPSEAASLEGLWVYVLDLKVERVQVLEILVRCQQDTLLYVSNGSDPEVILAHLPPCLPADMVQLGIGPEYEFR